MNREYVVLSSTLDIEEVGDRTGASSTYRCEAQFELLPANEPFRLERSVRKPVMNGPEKAIVVGPAGEEVWTDRFGRVKIQFGWDRQGKLDEHAGIWLRLVSPWQGADMVATFLPRIGHEVAVMHYYGDPDLPVITGSPVNEFRQPTLGLPANQAVAVSASDRYSPLGKLRPRLTLPALVQCRPLDRGVPCNTELSPVSPSRRNPSNFAGSVQKVLRA
ncbi:phage baseplate assembly protein V [Burkholderia cenocepacia]|uniref:phage baseplate assembly protein V n=1 Tax=Burkholderia cenocepacia TaxID=95486 RepID=UPI00406C3E03